MATHGARGGAPRLAIAARDRHFPAGPATRVDDDVLRDGAQPVAHRSRPDRHRRGRTADLDLRIESVSEGVLVSGTVSGPTSGECARCLTPVTGDGEIDLTELFAYPDSATDETTESDELGRVGTSGERDTVDLEQPIIDAIGLALPFSPLCGPDCAGLCPHCGVPLATAEPGHHHEQIDPRWARLTDILDQEDARERRADATAQGLGRRPPTTLLTLALTHRCYAYEHGGLPTNERLEFLGDSVLGLAVTDGSTARTRTCPEGQLAKLRASVVNMQRARRRGAHARPGLGAYLLLGRGEETTGGRDKSSILADAVEALLGAIYLQHGIDVSRALVLRLFGDLMNAAPTAGRGPGLEDQPAGAHRGRGSGRAGVPVTDDRARTTTRSSRRRRWWRPRPRRRGRPDQEGRRAEGRPGRVRGAVR